MYPMFLTEQFKYNSKPVRTLVRTTKEKKETHLNPSLLTGPSKEHL